MYVFYKNDKKIIINIIKGEHNEHHKIDPEIIESYYSYPSNMSSKIGVLNPQKPKIYDEDEMINSGKNIRFLTDKKQIILS